MRDQGEWIDEILRHLDLTSKADANMRSLSGGMKRRVLVGQALVHKPPVIVLDEPTAGVDVELRQSLWGFIRKLNRDGHTIILTTHYLEEAEALCGRIAMLKAGRVVALDSTQNLLSRFPGIDRAGWWPQRVPAAWQPRVVREDARVHHIGLESYAELESLLAALREEDIAIDELAHRGDRPRAGVSEDHEESGTRTWKAKATALHEADAPMTREDRGRSRRCAAWRPP